MTAVNKNQNVSYDFLVKLLVVGDTNVGKTSIVLRYCDGVFEGSSFPLGKFHKILN